MTLGEAEGGVDRAGDREWKRYLCQILWIACTDQNCVAQGMASSRALEACGTPKSPASWVIALRRRPTLWFHVFKARAVVLAFP